MKCRLMVAVHTYAHTHMHVHTHTHACTYTYTVIHICTHVHKHKTHSDTHGIQYSKLIKPFKTLVSSDKGQLAIGEVVSAWVANSQQEY